MGNSKNIPQMSKSPSAGNIFLTRLPTPAGKQPAGWGVCKAAVAGGSCPVQLWGCALHCSHCKTWSRGPSAPSADTVPSCILYAFSCILKAGLICLLMHCPAAVQVLLGRFEKPTEAEWHGTRFNTGAIKVVPVVPSWAFTVQGDEWTLRALPQQQTFAPGLPFVFCLPLNQLNNKSSNSAMQLLESFPKRLFPATQAAASSHHPETLKHLSKKKTWYHRGLLFPVEQPSSCPQSRATNYWDNAIITAPPSPSPSKWSSSSCRGRLGHQRQKQQFLTHPWLEQGVGLALLQGLTQKLHLTLPSLAQEESSFGSLSRLTSFRPSKDSKQLWRVQSKACSEQAWSNQLVQVLVNKKHKTPQMPQDIIP